MGRGANKVADSRSILYGAAPARSKATVLEAPSQAPEESLPVTMQLVDSSNVFIESVGYDPAAHKLYVKLHNGAAYVYSSVSLNKFEALLAADSVGSYFNRVIKNHYSCRKL